MSTRAELLLGADFEGNEGFCDTVVNALKNHWRVSNPCVNMTERRPGEILSDPDDDKLYHVGGESGYPCDEVLQETRSPDAEPIFNTVELGNNNIRTDSRIRAYLSNNQLNIVTGNWTKVLLDAETYDTGGNFDVGNNRFAAPVDGFYLIIGQVRWQETVDGARWLAAIYINGARIVVSDSHSGSTEILSCNIVDILYVPATQFIELYCYHNAGVNTPDVYGGSDSTYLAIHLLSI